MLNAKRMVNGSSNVCGTDTEVVRVKPGAIVLWLIWRVLASPVRMLRIKVMGEWDSKGQLINPGLPGKKTRTRW